MSVSRTTVALDPEENGRRFFVCRDGCSKWVSPKISTKSGFPRALRVQPRLCRPFEDPEAGGKLVRLYGAVTVILTQRGGTPERN